jgi:hypothetical protein
MVRRVLSVLALLPLLLPPGLCICHTATAACAAGTARDGDGHARLAHLCLAHNCQGEDPSHGPHGHAPGCPALQGVDHWVARPGTAVQVTSLDVVDQAVPLAAGALPPGAADSSPRLGCPKLSTPLYLTLRTLRV